MSVSPRSETAPATEEGWERRAPPPAAEPGVLPLLAAFVLLVNLVDSERRGET
jgi:hypothetical protein